LFEVIAEQLLELDQVGGIAVQPVREALVEGCARRFGQRVVCRVTDEYVTKPKRVFARELRLVRTDELLSYQRGQPRRELDLVRSERLQSALMEEAPFDGPAFQHDPFRVVELLQT